VKPRFPLRIKFLAIALANLIVLVLLFLLFVRLQLRQEFESFLMATAREKILAVSRQLTLDLTPTSPEQYDALLDRYSETYGVRFLLYAPDGRQIAGPATALPAEVADRMRRYNPASPRAILSGRPGPPPFLVAAGSPQKYWVGVRTLLPERTILVLLSPTLWSNRFFFEMEPWLGILAIGMLASLVCWLPLVRGITRAITQMMSATAAIAEGRFDVQVETRRRDELGSLGQSVNRMAERLRSYVQGQKRFLGDAAHELRSPLGRMQMVLGILEERVKPEDRSYLRDLQEEVEYMSALTTELLVFARAEMRPDPIELVPLNLRQIVERAAEVEGKGSGDIQIEIDPGLRVRGDEKCLFRAVSNLVRNAIRYAGGQGPITISARRQDDRVVITVADCGPGVPEEALERIFTPFFRLESARDRKTGGTGLGLAIARSCVEACGGTVTCSNRKPHGLNVTLTLQAA
jgi:two-component system, OmpR family, sensor histidine kinase CpxA